MAIPRRCMGYVALVAQIFHLPDCIHKMFLSDIFVGVHFFFVWGVVGWGWGREGLLCSFLSSPHFFPRWMAASCGLARHHSAEDFFSGVAVIHQVAGKERGTIFG